MAFTTISADDRRLKRKTQEAAIFELAKKVKETTKCKSTIEFHPLTKDDPKRRSPHTTKLERLVGWKPKVSFEEGLKRTVTWFSQKVGIKVLCDCVWPLG